MSRVSHGPFHDAPSEDAAPPAEGREREESSARARELILKAWDAHQRGEPGVGPLATEALRHARESGSRVLEASALHTLGLAHHSTSSFEEARRFYTLASEKFRRLGRDDLRARTLGVRADVLMLQGRYRAALADARRARRIHRASGSARGSVQALNVTGNILHRLDRQEEALEVYEKAHRETLRIEGIERTRAIIDMNRANVLANLCRSRDAHRLYAKMIEWCRQQGFRSFVAQASYNEGCLLVMTGHWQEAYQRFEELGPVFAELGDRRHLALLDLDAAEVRLHLNLNDEAEEVAARAAAACEDLGLRYERARAEVIRGSALVRRGRPREALDAYRGAALDFAAEGNRTWGALTHLRIAAVRLTCGEVGAALDATVEARRMVGARGLPIVTLQARELEAQAALADGDLERASRASRAASRALRGSPTPWMEDLVWHTRGRILLAQGNKRAAMRALHRAAGQVESSRARLASDDLAIAFQGRGAGVYEDLIGLHLEGGEPGDDEAAFALAGRARAAALTALLERNRLRPPPQLSGDPLVDSLKERLNLIYNRMICSAGLAAPRSARRVEGLLAEARGVEEQITGRLRRSDERAVAPRGAAAGAEKPSELGRGLEPGATLVEYHAVEGRLVAFVRAGDRLEVVKGLPSLEAVQDAVLRMRFHMERPVHSSAAGGSSARGAPMAAGDRGIQASLRRLHEMVFEPLEEALGAGPIDIVPSGALHGVPFHALHDGRQFLLDRHELSILPYREFLSWRPPRRRDGGTLVAFGLGAAEIPAVRRELGAIGKAFSAMELRIDSDATTAEFRRLAAGASLLHVASHAIFRRDNPMYSLLRLHDGWIAAWELARMAIPARIAILSACETGRVRTDAGDEILGLARGLLAAGVPTLILSLWRVDDAAASLLMGALYRGLASGLPARSALHLAMREVRRSHPHPCHWAPFTLLGQPLARVEPRR